MKTFETLTKKFLESIDEVRDACKVKSQNSGKCEYLEETAIFKNLKNRVVFLENRICQLSSKRVSNFLQLSLMAPLSPTEMQLLEAIIRLASIMSQVSVSNNNLSRCQ